MALGSVKGDLALTIEQNELEASLRFKPDANGAEWTPDKLLRVLMDARIGGFNQKKAEELLQKFARSKAAMTVVVASGDPPELPQPELPEWADLDIPPELSEAGRALLAAAPQPLLYKIRIETVKTEKTVKKPGALPFLPAKTEKVTVTDRIEKREQVFPDTTVIRSGYAMKGQRIGILSQQKQGKPGRTIFGKPLPAPATEGSFFAGSGVIRNKNELVAEADGMVRIGERWVDLIPLPAHRWSVERSGDGATFFLNYSPGDPRLPAPTGGDILAKAAELGGDPDSLISLDEATTMLADIVAAAEPVFSLSISRDRDAKVEVKVSPDGVTAHLSVHKGRGRGRPLELSAVSAALKASAVRGFNPEQLKKDVVEFYKSSRADLVDYLLAQGRAPLRGRDRQVAFAVGFMPDDKAGETRSRLEAHPSLAQVIPSLGEFPLAQAGKVAQIQLGQRIGELPAVAGGQDGVDVFGKTVPAIPGNDPAIRAYENVDFSRGILVSKADGLLLVAESEGEIKVRVVALRDARVEALVAPDAMSASVSLSAEGGLGLALTVEAVLAALAEKGVVQGLEPFSIAEAVADARAGKAVVMSVVARGKQAVPAGGVKLEWLIQRASGKMFRQAEGDRVDFREHDTMTRVAVDQPLLRLVVSGGAGEDGVDVLGRPVKALAEATGDKAPEHDASIREEKDAEGATILVAAAGGELLFEKGKLSIRERLAVKGDVGAATGNLKFPGAVQVAGSVLAGYSLVATGDIVVAGAVEAALVSSDESIHVAEGIKGARKGTIRARKGIEAAFAEQALLLAVEDIKVKTGCMLCNIKTNGRLLLGAERGTLIGGLTRARRGVEAAVIGSENYTKTEISFGQDYLVADQIEAEEREIEKVKSLILQADRSMKEFEKAGSGLDRIRQDKVKLMKLLEKRTLRVFELREKFEQHVPSEIRVRGSVYPGVILESHNRFYEVRSRKNGVIFSFDPALGRIVERPLK